MLIRHPIGGTRIEGGEAGDGSEVGRLGLGPEPSAHHVIDHLLTKRCHGLLRHGWRILDRVSTFYDYLPPEYKAAVFVSNSAFKESLKSTQFATSEASFGSNAKTVLGEARAWLGKHAAYPVVIWIHLLEPHTP
jgi:hypothetical protein